LGSLFLMQGLPTSATAGLQMRRMLESDVDAGFCLTQSVKWSHQLNDWRFNFALGSGWVVCDSQGEVHATAMWWPYGEQTATLGLIVVDIALQGQGVGRMLMQQLLEDTAPRALQLVATNAGLKLYQQCGFVTQCGIEQWQSADYVAGRMPVPAEVTLGPIRNADLPALVALDALAFGAQRGALLGAVVASGGGVIARRDGELVGFALSRPAGLGTIIGPIIATDQNLAGVLVDYCLSRLTGFVRVDIPDHATELGRLLGACGLQRVDRVTLMRRGNWPIKNAGAPGLWGLVSQALG
jgi:GNAT superfamily N-acetyltransferase